MNKLQVCGLTLLQCFFIIVSSSAQRIPVASPLEDVYRRAQLLGKLDSTISFAIRPLSIQAFKDTLNGFEHDSLFNGYQPELTFQNRKGSLAFKVLPVSWQQQYNSALPYGWNDGAMIPAKGYQTRISGGFFIKAGPLSIQVQPEYVYAANKGFEYDPKINDYEYSADLPVRFGDDPYSEVSWGQSSILLNIGAAAMGISNENLWWGPGMRNSILMSNTSRGFEHLTLHTNRPVHTAIGSFEGQIIAGKLRGSEYGKYANNPLYDDWRYLTSMALTYQPRWVPGLFMGLNRSFQVYSKDVKGFKGYFPFFTPFQKIKDRDNVVTGNDGKDQLASVYVRWLLAKAKTEIYVEYGVGDHSHNYRDFIMSPQHTRAYVFGLRKLMPLKRGSEEFIQLNAEITQLSQTTDRLVRTAQSFYTHFSIGQGYTNQGESLGAGIGPGGNLQSIDVSWVKGQKTLGFQFERYVHNNDYYDIVVKDFNGQSRRWVDLGAAAIGTWDFKNLLLNAKIQGIHSLNYQWQMRNYTPGTYYIPQNDILNFHGELGLTYRF